MIKVAVKNREMKKLASDSATGLMFLAKNGSTYPVTTTTLKACGYWTVAEIESRDYFDRWEATNETS